MKRESFSLHSCSTTSSCVSLHNMKRHCTGQKCAILNLFQHLVHTGCPKKSEFYNFSCLSAQVPSLLPAPGFAAGEGLEQTIKRNSKSHFFGTHCMCEMLENIKNGSMPFSERATSPGFVSLSFQDLRTSRTIRFANFLLFRCSVSRIES